jgi:hypothetical protein
VTLCHSYSFTLVEYTFLPNPSPSSLISLFRRRPVRFANAHVERMLVHLVYLVYLVCLVDRTGNSFRRTRQTRQTSPSALRQQEDGQAARLLSKLAHRPPYPPKDAIALRELYRRGEVSAEA